MIGLRWGWTMTAKAMIRDAILAGVALGSTMCAGVNVVLAQTAPVVRSRAVTGAPYSAVVEQRHTQTLADGTHIDLVSSVTKQFRDAQGRTRLENYMTREGATSETPNLIEILDPVTDKRYMLNPHDHTAQSFGMSQGASKAIVTSGELSTPVPVNGPTIRTGESERPEVTHASLGTDSMLGVEVTGSRITSVYPVGSRGNDQPLTIVIETWRSTELRIDMLRKQDDPRSGVVEWRVTQIDRTEPDSSLFQVPSDYEILVRQ